MLLILVSSENPFIKFPECTSSRKHKFRDVLIQKWLKQCANKGGSDSGKHYAATWHIPLRALQGYSCKRKDAPGAQFPWCMSKEDGKYYDCDDSLLIQRSEWSGVSDESYYYVAPMITDARFCSDLLQSYKTPAKNPEQASMTTRSNSMSTVTPRIASEHPSEMSSLTGSSPSQDPFERATELICEMHTRHAASHEAHDILTDIQRVLLKISRERAQDRKRIDGLREQIEVMKEDNEVMKSAVEKCFSFGVNGLLLTDAQWHKENPKACKTYFLFPTFDVMKTYLRIFWPDDFGDGVPENKRFAYSMPKTKFTEFEKCLVTLMRLNGTGERLCDLEIIWGRSRAAIRRAIRKWAPKIAAVGNMLSILDIPEAYLTGSCPQSFKDAKMERVAGLVDGKVIMTAENRQHSICKRASWSDKVKHGGTIVLQYCTPSGLIFDHSPVMLGRASETLIVKHMGLNSSPLTLTLESDDGKVVTHEWPRRLGKILKGWNMLVDRGFARHSTLYPNKNFHFYPSFAGKRDQFTKDERRKDKSLCTLRWVNEANFSRMLYVRGLQDIVGWHFIPLIPAAVSWGFAMSNLQQPWGDTPASPRVGACEGHGDLRSEDEGNGSEDDITYLEDSHSDDSMCSVDSYDVSDTDDGIDFGSANKRQYSPDRRGAEERERVSPDRRRRRRK